MGQAKSLSEDELSNLYKEFGLLDIAIHLGNTGHKNCDWVFEMQNSYQRRCSQALSEIKQGLAKIIEANLKEVDRTVLGNGSAMAVEKPFQFLEKSQFTI